MRSILLLISTAVFVAAPLKTAAQSDWRRPQRPADYLAAGLMMVDAGVSVANGFAFSMGTADKAKGYLGIGLGVASLGFAGTAYALSDEGDDLHDRFAIMMGTAGTAALVTGVLAVRQARRNEEALESGLSSLSLSPAVMSDGDRGKAYGLEFKFDF